MRVGLVGCGFIGRIHSWALWALRSTGVVDVHVTAVCDPDAERARSLADPHGAEFVELDALLGLVDAVYVCTPTAQHADLVEAAAARGVAVYCEKPLAPNLAEAERVALALQRVPHQVGLVLRCAPVFERLAAELASGRHGRPMAVMLRDDQYFPIQGQYGSAWRSQMDVAGGGTLIEHSIHDLDLFRWLCGDPAELTCRTSSFFEHPGIEDLAVATLSWPGGCRANLVSIWHQVLTRTSTRRLEAFCERGFLWTDDDNTGPLHVETSEGTEVIACDPPSWVDGIRVPEPSRRALGLYAEASRRFLASLEAGSAGYPGAGDALAAHRLVDAAYRSAALGGRAIAT
jgi:predicted dehydrogenase